MIVVFGSFNIDVVMMVERLPGPGETVLGGEYLLVPGGKGANQACAAARATRGAIGVAMVGKVGTDDWGDLALGPLTEAGADLSVVERASAPTACAVISVDAAGENAISVASGANLEAEADQVPDAMLQPGHWLVLQMEVRFEENWRLLERARRRGCKVMLNVAPAAPVPPDILAALDVVVFNEVEGRMIMEGMGLAEDDPVRVARHLRDAHGLTAIATVGPAGAVAYAPGEAWQAPALPVTPVDTTGAGDAFIGSLVVALAAGAALPDALKRASVGAGLCCEIRGAQTSFPWAEQIERRLGEIEAPRPIDD